jgi:hypothetical protein
MGQGIASKPVCEDTKNNHHDGDIGLPEGCHGREMEGHKMGENVLARICQLIRFPPCVVSL